MCLPSAAVSTAPPLMDVRTARDSSAAAPVSRSNFADPRRDRRRLRAARLGGRRPRGGVDTSCRSPSCCLVRRDDGDPATPCRSPARRPTPSARPRAGSARGRPPGRRPARGRRSRPTACRRRHSAARRCVTGGYTPGTAQLAATACSNGTPESVERPELAGLRVDGGDDQLARRPGGADQPRPITSTPLCSVGVTPAFSAASASAPIRRGTRRPSAAAEHRPPELGEGGPVEPRRLLRRRGRQLPLYIASSAAPQATCAPTTDPADVPTTRSAPLRSTPASASPATPRLPRDAGDAPAAEDEGGALVAHGSHLTDTRTCLDSACELSHAVRPVPPTKWIRMTATHAPATAASWPPGLPRSLDYPQVPVGSILRAAVRRWGDREAFIDHTYRSPSPNWAPRARRRRLAGRPRRRPGGRRRRPHPELPAVPAALLRDPGRGDLLPHQSAAARARPRRPAHRRRRHRADHLGPGAAVRPQRAGPTPVRTVVVTGEAHTLDFAARLTGWRTATSTPPTSSAPTHRPAP